MRTMDSWYQALRRNIMRLVKVLWKHQGVKEATWEREDTMRATYPSYLRTKVRYLIFGTTINYCISMCLCVLVCVNFEDEILLRGEECKTREIFNFSEK